MQYAPSGRTRNISHSRPAAAWKASHKLLDKRFRFTTSTVRTMAVNVLPYAVEHYNSLPELRVVKGQFESARASEILFTEIGRALVKHHVENILGVILLHNHFLLEPHEMLVNVDSVAVPWDTASGAKELASVKASAWRFTENGIVAYEFAHAAEEVALQCHQMQTFLLELGAILEKWNLANIFGICALSEKNLDRPTTMEFTSGRANITLPFDIAPHDGNVIDAMWQFSSDPLGSSVHAGSSSEGQRDTISIRDTLRVD